MEPVSPEPMAEVSVFPPVLASASKSPSSVCWLTRQLPAIFGRTRATAGGSEIGTTSRLGDLVTVAIRMVQVLEAAPQVGRRPARQGWLRRRNHG